MLSSRGIWRSDEDFDEVGVVLRGEGVADALGADVEGGPDALRAGGFAGVAGEAEAGGFGFGVELAEVVGGAASSSPPMPMPTMLG